MADFDLLVLGDCNADVLLHGGEVEPLFGQAERLVQHGSLTIGGSGAITACGAARLGMRTALVAVVGDDPLGRLTLEAVRDRGVDVSGCVVDAHRPTGVTVVLSRGVDRAILTAPGTAADLTPEHVDVDLVRASRHVHASSHFLQNALRPGLPKLLAAARDEGASTSIDPNWDPREEWNGDLSLALAAATFFLPNEEEVRRIAWKLVGSVPPAGSDWESANALSPGAAAAAIATRNGPTVVVKLGAQGALLRHPTGGTEEIRVPAHQPMAPLLDTTGAGDSFDAGFLAGLLAGWPLERAMRLGCVCGALSARALGGTDAQPSMDQALEAMGVHE